ncbi:hypothetical protein KAR91_65825 [Candidatus Pacearchaeota archaeon]|nr:hypothetical protein [Candidatus Pacearchaeota archaeon]
MIESSRKYTRVPCNLLTSVYRLVLIASSHEFPCSCGMNEAGEDMHLELCDVWTSPALKSLAEDVGKHLCAGELT